MIKIKVSKSAIRSLIAIAGASTFVCALSVPAFALSTAPSSKPADAGIVTISSKYDRSAPLAGQQYAGEEEEENEAQPYNGEQAEHMRHEQEEQEGAEALHNLGEEGEEHAERLRNRVEEERAEHERHEMEEHQPYQEQEPENDND